MYVKSIPSYIVSSSMWFLSFIKEKILQKRDQNNLKISSLFNGDYMIEAKFGNALYIIN